MVAAATLLPRDLEAQVLKQTHRRVRDLRIEMRPGRLVLRGSANSYYVKQLAQHAVMATVPTDVRVENAICVVRGVI
jgi:hypothetical protein